MLKSYFVTNKVKSIGKELEELKIEYLDGQSKRISSESEDKAYGAIKIFMEHHNKTTLTRNDLGITNNPEQPNPQIQLLDQLEQYFIQNNIRLIRRENNRLIIEFNEENSPNNHFPTTEQQEQINNYLQQSNQQELTLESIRRERERESKN
jgi:hypothetical protein